MENFYTPEQIAERIQINVQTILSYIRDGKLKAMKLDKGYRITESDFQAFVQSSRVARTPEDYLQQLGIQKKYKAFRKTFMRPVMELENPIPNHQLDKLLQEASVRDRQGYRAFPLPGASIMEEKQERKFDGLLLQKEITFAGELFFFAFASTRGELLTAESLWEDSEGSRFQNAIGLLTSIGIMYRGLLFISRYYSKIITGGEIDFSFIIDNPLGRKLIMDSEKPTIWFADQYIATTEDPIIIERKISITMTPDEAKEKLFGMVKDFLWYFRCDWLEETVIKQRIEEVAKNAIL